MNSNFNRKRKALKSLSYSTRRRQIKREAIETVERIRHEVDLPSYDLREGSGQEQCDSFQCLEPETTETPTITVHKALTDYAQVKNNHVSNSACSEDYCNVNNFSDAEEYLLQASEKGDDLQISLQKWAVKHRIAHNALGDLLKILCIDNPNLCKDPRTLLKTKTKYSVCVIPGGDFYYFGLEVGLRYN